MCSRELMTNLAEKILINSSFAKLPELDVRNMSVVVVEVYINKDAE